MALYFKENIRFLREYKNLKQSEIAFHSGLQPTTWNNYENGVSVPTIEGLIKISKYLGVTETELLHEDLSKRSDLSVKPKASQNLKKSDLSGDAKGDLSSINAAKITIKELKKEIEMRDKVIADKDKLIKALEGQAEALKLATDQLRSRIKDK